MKKALLIVAAILSLFTFNLSAQTAPAGGKRPPQAKTRAEFDDYNKAYALNGGAAVEKAADDFSAKYPNSELKQYLYTKALHDYQSENNPEKMLVMGRKVLSLDPENTVALVLTATVLSDSLSDTDTDREQKIAEIRKDAEHALQTVDSNFTPPANATPEQVAAYKNTLQSMAHSALGIVALKMKDDPAAERELKLAADLNKSQPDPYIFYHLALAQDHQMKYADALKSIDQALRYTDSNPDLGTLAKDERERLVALNKVTAPNTGPQPAESQPKPQPAGSQPKSQPGGSPPKPEPTASQPK